MAKALCRATFPAALVFPSKVLCAGPNSYWRIALWRWRLFCTYKFNKNKKKKNKKSRFQGVDAPKPVQKAAYYDISYWLCIGKLLFDLIGSMSLEDYVSYLLWKCTCCLYLTPLPLPVNVISFPLSFIYFLLILSHSSYCSPYRVFLFYCPFWFVCSLWPFYISQSSFLGCFVLVLFSSV